MQPSRRLDFDEFIPDEARYTPAELSYARLPSFVKLKKQILGFRWRDDAWVGEPLHPFKPVGLILWGVSEGMKISQYRLSQQLEVLASWDPVPAQFFTMAKSYEQLAELVESGILPPSWCDFSWCDVGQLIRVELQDPHGERLKEPGLVQVAMWGTSRQ